ncbi:MAG: LysR family transcriptional regulator [Clostridiales bacterium]|nr:LysR family transcriptional regulator [Clostridiales bacterium]
MTLQQMRYAIMIADKGSMNEAAKSLFISQPSLSGTIKELEKEIGISIFRRTNRGITITAEGKEFLSYARQMIEQYRMMEERYLDNKTTKKKFHVSTQHYTFAVNAFATLVQKFGMDEYEFAIYETRTHEIMDDVKNFRSEIGILCLNDFNEKVLTKVLHENDLEFHKLFSCNTYVYLSSSNPLASQKVITMKELEDYPCLSFDQGEYNSFYFNEEVLSTYEYKKLIKVNDRATILNMMVAINGYTLCSGIICEELNGSGFCAIPLACDDIMTIGYVTRRGVTLSKLGNLYIEELRKCQKDVL